MREKTSDLEGADVRRTERAVKTATDDRYSIGRLLSPRDEAIDLDLPSWNAALALTRKIWAEDPERVKKQKEPEAPSGPALRKIRGHGAPGVEAHPERGLLLIYLLELTGIEEAPKDPVVAFGISFPGSKSGTKVEYKVNNVLWEQEYADAE